MDDTANLKIEVISDSICPWCYIGKRRLEGALRLLGTPSARVEWKPFELNPGMPIEGMDRREYRTRKFGSWSYSQQLDAQVRAAGEQVGLSFAHDKMERTPNTLASHKLIWLASQRGTQDAVVEAIFRAYFCEGRDIGDPDVLVALGGSAGLSEVEVRRALLDEEITREVLNDEATSRHMAVQGVPTFVVNGLRVASGAHPEQVLAEIFRKTAAGAVHTIF
ncbi:DsbA family oxidoreductase [Verrucomicrobiota bacterium sgz303538]